MRYRTQTNDRPSTPTLSDCDKQMLDAIRLMLGLGPFYTGRDRCECKPDRLLIWDAWPNLGIGFTFDDRKPRRGGDESDG